MEWCEERVTVSVVPEDSTGNANSNEILYEKCETVCRDDIDSNAPSTETISEDVTYAVVNPADRVETIEELVYVNENAAFEMPHLPNGQLGPKEIPPAPGLYLVE
ncbi:uncharacterized protein LOC129587050 [Paramacrobiotus metropolitanus]|uniref:uncharacterized protein LOC129587050 n=1 Tax=Paramacrobiotus metropolitanus TaxID=2943436 RepID=UPI0024462CD9|nr:uncharacterized protein LOC129587050 [Paramacrobiotus metropolitanus]